MKNKIKSFILNSKNIPLLTIIIYTIGFFVWNSYLSTFGFFEYNIVQVRYLSAGFLYILIYVIIYLIIFLGEKEIKSKSLIIAFLISLIIFPNVFYKIPQHFFGGRPIPVNIIGDTKQIEYLSNFGIQTHLNGDDKESIQTKSVCLIYKNNDYIVFANIEKDENNEYSQTRVISLANESFKGFHSINKEYEDSAKEDCKKVIDLLRKK